MFKMSHLLVVLIACTAILSVSFILATGSETEKGNTDMEMEESGSINTFSWDVFDKLNDDKVFYSSYGLYTALAMLLNGAEPGSDTEKELLNVLHARDGLTVNSDLKCLQDLLISDDGFRFASSDLILVDETYASGKGVNKDFSKTIEDVFGGSVKTVDIRNNTAAVKELIKKWVNDNTDGFIPDYDSIMDSSTLTDILNVVYFKGDWVYKFEDSFTKSFRNSDGKESDVTMMLRQFGPGTIGYYEDSKYRGISIPYESEGKETVSMIIVIPVDKGTDIKDRWSGETAAYRESFMEKVRTGSLDSKRMEVLLPKLDIDLSYDLKELFSALGIDISMSDSAEFTKIIEGEYLKVTDGKHQAKLKVDEEGTEAAAVTEIIMKNTAVLDMNPIMEFHCDIPFVFTITENGYGVDLFTGYIGTLKSDA